MLSRMETIEMNQLVSAWVSGWVSAAFEACAAFGNAGDGSPVCAACGWLEAEHEPETAEVRALPTRTLSGPTPTRIAS
ncbi:MAG: hypothetical protein QOC79_693 [Actinomycetota bacterium]|jgi:hypothetical protein|nr:hypothetical protein [Actinomycetota bacterium]